MRETNINKVMGGSEEDRKEVSEAMAKSFREQKLWRLLGREKTQEEIVIANFANKATGAIAKAYGIEDPADMPSQNIHILTEENFKKLAAQEKIKAKGYMVGFMSLKKQALFILDRGDGLFHFMHALTHELYHFKSYQSLIIENAADAKTKITHRRSGWGVRLRKQDKAAFADMDEAVVDELAIRTLTAIIDNFGAANLPPEIKNQLKAEYEKEGFPDIYISTYGPEKLRLRDMVIEIYNKNKGKFKTADEVFNLFAQAVFTGNLIPVARLVEKTFGKGSFRTIGEEGMPQSEIEKSIEE